MKQLRQLAINGVSLVTRPFFQGAAIICLHRVLPEEEKSPLSIPRDLEMTPQFLETMVKVMRNEGYQFVPLERVLEIIKTSPLTRYCAITFDDGYLDNLTHAYPVLAALDVPFTIYVTSGFINGALEPWWYRLQRLLTGPEPLQLPSPSGPVSVALDGQDSREHHYCEIYQHIKGLLPGERENRLSDLADINPEALLTTDAVPFLSDSDLNLLSNSDLVDIGAHTVSHPNLTLLDPASIEREMRESKETLEAWIGRPVFDFSYPHGQANPGIAQMARKAGFRSATTTRAAMLRKRSPDPFLLPRLCFGGEVEDSRQLVRTVRGVYSKCWR
jgi:peptidoglycan/xylan/chitin deacetylase (PgdA/CDA1 family)